MLTRLLLNISAWVMLTKLVKSKFYRFWIYPEKDELWGIECERLIISLKNSGFGRWDEVMRKGKPLSSSWRISLPFEDSLAYYFVNRFSFKQEIENLRSHGIEVDDWLEGWYWSCEELGYNGNRIHTFNMCDGSYSTHDRYNTNGFVRYALICMH